MPSGYPVVDVDHGAGFANVGAESGNPVLTRLRSVNGWEIALWAVAVVLIVASVQVSVYATQHLYMGSYASECDSNGVCTSPASVVYLQSALSLSPAALAAGLFSGIAAIAVRAVNTAARRRATAEAAQNPAAAQADPSDAMAEPRWYIGSAPEDSSQSSRTASPFPAPPVPTYPDAAPTGVASALVSQSSFARPSSAPPAERDLSAFQRPRDDSDY
jgi:hypothetical protein